MGCANSRPVKETISKSQTKQSQRKNKITPEPKEKVQKQFRKDSLSVHSCRSISISHKSINVKKKTKKKRYYNKGNDPIVVIVPSKQRKNSVKNSNKKIQTSPNYSVEIEMCKKYGFNDPEELKQAINVFKFQRLRSNQHRLSSGKIGAPLGKHPSIQGMIMVNSQEKRFISDPQSSNITGKFQTFAPPSINSLKKVSKKENQNIKKVIKIAEENEIELVNSISSDDISASRLKIRVPLGFEKPEDTINDTLRFEHEKDKLGMSTDDIVLLHRKKYRMMNGKMELNQKDKIVENIQKLDISNIQFKNETPEQNYPRININTPVKSQIIEVSHDGSNSEATLSHIIKTLKGSQRGEDKKKFKKKRRDLRFETFNSESESSSHFTMKKFQLQKRRKGSGSRKSRKSVFSKKSEKIEKEKSDSVASSNLKRSVTYGYKHENGNRLHPKSKFNQFCNLAKEGFKIVKSSRKLVSKNKIDSKEGILTPKSMY